MRKWHRWLSLFFGIFMLWMSVTGVLSQIVPLVQAQPGGPDKGKGAPMAVSTLKPDFVCPADVSCRPKQPRGGGNIVGLLHHLHSGEAVGPVGVLISTLTGFALMFFSISGLWLYVQMWRFRKSRDLAPRWLWK